MNAPDRVGFFEFDDKHGFSKPRREAATQWMCKWLLGKDDKIVEGDFPSFTDADLQCTRSGQVLEDFKGKSVFHFNAAFAKHHAAERAKFADRPAAERTADIKRLLGLRDEDLKRAATLGATAVEGDQPARQRVTFVTEPGIRVHGSWHNKGRGRGTLIVHLPDRGMSEDGAPAKAMEELIKQGREVLSLDLRGLGVTSPSPPGAKPSFFGVDFKHSFLSLHLNRPLLGQRVLDVLVVLRESGVAESAKRGIHLYGEGVAGLVALHAAALLDRKDVETTLDGSLAAWQSIFDIPVTYNQLSSIVPGAMKTYDLPDLVATLAPRKLTIRGPLDAAQRPVSQEALDAMYARCTAAFRDAPRQLTLEAR
jgi:hypothetical protein